MSVKRYWLLIAPIGLALINYVLVYIDSWSCPLVWHWSFKCLCLWRDIDSWLCPLIWRWLIMSLCLWRDIDSWLCPLVWRWLVMCLCPWRTLIADCAHWFGIDHLSGCVCGETLIADRVHWSGVDRLWACVRTLIAEEIVSGFSIDN